MRPIDADALMEDIGQTVRFSCRDGVPSAEMRGANKVIDRIEVAPTISPDEVRGVGKWITDRTWEHDGEPYCSVCDFEQSFARFQKFKFCPNCGAKMEVSEDG